MEKNEDFNWSVLAIFNHFILFSTHYIHFHPLHPLQGENCDSSICSRLVENEDCNDKFRIESVKPSRNLVFGGKSLVITCSLGGVAQVQNLKISTDTARDSDAATDSTLTRCVIHHNTDWHWQSFIPLTMTRWHHCLVWSSFSWHVVWFDPTWPDILPHSWPWIHEVTPVHRALKHSIFMLAWTSHNSEDASVKNAGEHVSNL